MVEFEVKKQKHQKTYEPTERNLACDSTQSALGDCDQNSECGMNGKDLCKIHPHPHTQTYTDAMNHNASSVSKVQILDLQEEKLTNVFCWNNNSVHVKCILKFFILIFRRYWILLPFLPVCALAFYSF